MAAATIHGRMATRRRLRRPLIAVWVGYLAPGIESRRGASARRIDDGGLLGGGGSVGAKSTRGRGYL
jgi:uncharacterized membrane protein YgcG